MVWYQAYALVASALWTPNLWYRMAGLSSANQLGGMCTCQKVDCVTRVDHSGRLLAPRSVPRLVLSDTAEYFYMHDLAFTWIHYIVGFAWMRLSFLVRFGIHQISGLRLNMVVPPCMIWSSPGWGLLASTLSWLGCTVVVVFTWIGWSFLAWLDLHLNIVFFACMRW